MILISFFVISNFLYFLQCTCGSLPVQKETLIHYIHTSEATSICPLSSGTFSEGGRPFLSSWKHDLQVLLSKVFLSPYSQLPLSLQSQGAWKFARAAASQGCCFTLPMLSGQLLAASRTQLALKWQGNFQFLKTHFLSMLAAKYFMPSGPVAPWGPACGDLSACRYDEKMVPWWEEWGKIELVEGDWRGKRGRNEEQVLSYTFPLCHVQGAWEMRRGIALGVNPHSVTLPVWWSCTKLPKPLWFHHPISDDRVETWFPIPKMNGLDLIISEVLQLLCSMVPVWNDTLFPVHLSILCL